MTEGPSADPEKQSARERLGTLWARSLTGGAFTLASKVIRVILIIVSYAALGRLLDPVEFGLVNMITPILFFIMIFADMGFSMVLVQRKELSDREISALFWMSILTGLFFALFCAFVISPLFAYLIYDETRILMLAAVLSIEIFLFSLRSQYNAMMLRDLKFNSIAVIQLLANALATGVAIYCAASGYGAWALVFMRLSQGVFETICYLAFVRWVPQIVSVRALPLEMIKFGANLTGYRTADYTNRTLNNILVGAVHGAAALGPFAVAARLMRLPIDEFSGALARICTTALSRLQDDHKEFELYYCRMLFLICLIGVPIITFAAVMAEPIVVLFLGEKWVSAAPIFSFLALASISQLLTSTVGWTQISTARTDRIFRWSVYMVPLTLLSFLIGSHWGPIGVAAAYGFIVLVMTVPTFKYALATSPVSEKAVWRAVIPGLAASAAVAGALWIYIVLMPEFAMSLAGLVGAAGVAAPVFVVSLGIALGPADVKKYLNLARAKFAKS